MEKKTIVVTGASGYLGSWIVKTALDHGYTVRGTVRDPENEEKVGHLKELDGAKRLSLYQADLLAAGAFDEAAKGADAIVHSASPYIVQNVEDGYKQLVEPAVEGTRNVLAAAGRAESVGRVVLTSSVVAIMGDAAEAKEYPDRVVDESRWNHTSTVQKSAYNYSKTAAEKEAWQIAGDQESWDMIVINPAFIIGPSLSARQDGTSVQLLKQLGDGTLKQGAPGLVFGIVDVRDVALAHINALKPNVGPGRFILADKVRGFDDLAKTLHVEFGDRFQIPKRGIPKFLFWLAAPSVGLERKYVSRNANIRFTLDNHRSRDILGIDYRDVDASVVEHFQQLVDQGAVKPAV